MTSMVRTFHDAFGIENAEGQRAVNAHPKGYLLYKA